MACIRPGPTCAVFQGCPAAHSPGNRPSPPGLLQLKGGTAVLVTLKAEADAVLEIDTEAGKAAVSLKEIAFGPPRKYLDGAIRVCRARRRHGWPSPIPTTIIRRPQRGPDGSVWVAFVAYQSGGEPDMEAAENGDFRSLRAPAATAIRSAWSSFDGKQWSAPLPVTEPLLDLWKPTVAVDGAGKVWVAWSQNVGGNWDLYRRSYDPPADQWSADRADDDRPGRRHQRRFRHRRRRATSGGPGRDGASKHFQIFLIGDDAGRRADRRDRQSGQSLGPGHCGRLEGQRVRGLGQL